MRDKIKSLLRWAGIFLLCFLTIYLVIFFGGWKLFESSDPILMEIGTALILSIFVFAFNEVVTKLEQRIKSLEEDIQALKEKMKS